MRGHVFTNGYTGRQVDFVGVLFGEWRADVIHD